VGKNPELHFSIFILPTPPPIGWDFKKNILKPKVVRIV
jgi:hypothetical protein